MSKEAIILAGGFGTRLRSVVADMPKPLAPVAGRPFLAILLENLARQGFSAAVLSVGFKHEMIQAAFGDSFAGLSLRYAVEEQPLGTGGAIRLAARQCHEDAVFVLNGDSYVEVDFYGMMQTHREQGARLSVCAVSVEDAGRYGGLLLQGRHIIGFAEKTAAGPGLINAGVYLLQRDILESMDLPEVFSFEKDVLTAKLDEVRPIAYPTQGAFIDIGIPQDYQRAQGLFAHC